MFNLFKSKNKEKKDILTLINELCNDLKNLIFDFWLPYDDKLDINKIYFFKKKIYPYFGIRRSDFTSIIFETHLMKIYSCHNDFNINKFDKKESFYQIKNIFNSKTMNFNDNFNINDKIDEKIIYALNLFINKFKEKSLIFFQENSNHIFGKEEININFDFKNNLNSLILNHNYDNSLILNNDNENDNDNDNHKNKISIFFNSDKTKTPLIIDNFESLQNVLINDNFYSRPTIKYNAKYNDVKYILKLDYSFLSDIYENFKIFDSKNNDIKESKVNEISINLKIHQILIFDDLYENMKI